MRDRKVSKDSVYNKRNKMLADLRGKFWADKEPWDNSKDDELLEGWLVYELPITDPVNPSFQSVIGRTRQSVYTRTWKICAKHLNQTHGSNRDPIYEKGHGSHQCGHLSKGPC